MIKLMVIISLLMQVVTFPAAYFIERGLIQVPVWSAVLVGGLLVASAFLGVIVSVPRMLFIPDFGSPEEKNFFYKHLFATVYFIWVAIVGILTLLPNVPLL